ncbi:uncharacterized protein PV09_08745 [Verruconis gallopava]|uniref:Oxidoreductase n=1 Tax=Verruconis gallopava TaxID=253628 RepID=A0A0D1ZYS5_9PEZI|nr:uncharacterized protein PV09_08745 [Verruconis gallopava]KIV99567.1 hypothetical protein PV09_08745 [Verruconis gallopava]
MSASMNTILVIGGTSGIGENFARRFHKMGKSVIVTGRREQKLAELKDSMSGLQTYVFDMTDLTAIPAHVEELFTRFPSINTVWINGGIQYSSDVKDLASTTDAKVVAEITTNVTAPILIGRHVIPRLLAQKGETVFMITSSGLGYVPVGAMFPVYCPTKAAVHDYMVGVRQALKGTNVNVIEIVPPYVGGTQLGAEHEHKVRHLKPLPMNEFVDEIFGVLDNSDAKDLKEVAVGTAVPRVKAWRDGIGAILAQGLGG